MHALIPTAAVDPHGQALAALQGIAQLGIILYMFSVGVSLDSSVLRRHAHAAVAVSHAGIVVPFVAGAALALWLYPMLSHEGISFASFALFVGVAMSVTAFPVSRKNSIRRERARESHFPNRNRTRNRTRVFSYSSSDSSFVLGSCDPRTHPSSISQMATSRIPGLNPVPRLHNANGRWPLPQRPLRGRSSQSVFCSLKTFEPQRHREHREAPIDDNVLHGKRCRRRKQSQETLCALGVSVVQIAFGK